jgi:arsenate reductase (thioredoxin)
LPTEDLRSKSWDELTAPGMPELHFVITVCGNAAEETCPTWPGQPVTAHWGVDDPAAVKGSDAERLRAFERALRELEARIKLFVALPLESLDRLALQSRLGQIAGASATTTTT